jgi:hypothetical protein
MQVYQCRWDCQGIGDRIRGSMWLLRLAIAHKKVLIVIWESPAPLDTFLLPNEVGRRRCSTPHNTRWLGHRRAPRLAALHLERGPQRLLSGRRHKCPFVHAD